MKAGENTKWIKEGESVPQNYSKLIGFEKRYIGWEYDEDDDCHYLQTPAKIHLYETWFLYARNF